MNTAQRTNLSPTWHMVLMGLMSLVLFLGGLSSPGPEQRLPVDFIGAEIPNEGLLHPTHLSARDERAFTDGLLFSYERTWSVAPRNVKFPVPRKQVTFFLRPIAPLLPPAPERRLLIHERAHLPYPGWDGPIPFALPPPLAV